MAATTLWRLQVEGETVEEVREFDYSSDIMAVGEECRWQVVNAGRKYVGKLLDGSKADIYAINADVNGGQPTHKFSGRIIQRTATYSAQGNTIDLGIFDLGWHLTNCDAPLWFKLDRANFIDLINPDKHIVGKNGVRGYFLDPSFGFTGYSTDGLQKRLTKQGVAAIRANQQRTLDPVFTVQVEPGEKLHGKIAEYARRENRLINVSPTGEIQAFLPDYSQRPLYSFRVAEYGQSNDTVISAKEIQNCSTKYTKVECVGQQLEYEGAQDSKDPNATKKRGGVSHPELLPFLNRLSVADGDMYTPGLAQKLADWYYKRGRYDAYALELVVPNHHQNGVWYEADTMANVDIEDLGIRGPLYVSAVRYGITQEQGDISTLTLRIPGLLSASFGAYPQPPVLKSAREPGTQPKQENNQ